MMSLMCDATTQFLISQCYALMCFITESNQKFYSLCVPLRQHFEANGKIESVKNWGIECHHLSIARASAVIPSHNCVSAKKNLDATPFCLTQLQNNFHNIVHVSWFHIILCFVLLMCLLQIVSPKKLDSSCADRVFLKTYFWIPPPQVYFKSYIYRIVVSNKFLALIYRLSSTYLLNSATKTYYTFST